MYGPNNLQDGRIHTLYFSATQSEELRRVESKFKILNQCIIRIV